VRKLKIVFPLVVFIGLLSVVGCSKSNNNNSTSNKDSVIYSSWTQLAMTYSTADSDYEQSISAPILTQKVLSTSVILGYVGIITNSNDTATENASEFFDQAFDLGQIELFSLADFSTVSTGFLYRFMVIPGNTITSTALRKYSRQQLEKMSFKDIQNAINSPVQGIWSGISLAKPATP
jgi:hypothetical protein